MAEDVERLEQERDAARDSLSRLQQVWAENAPAVRYKQERDAARDALREIVDPISVMKRQMKPDEILNGAMAVQLSRDPEYLRSIARTALARLGEGGEG